MSGPRKNPCSTLFSYVPRVFPENMSKRFKSSAYLPGNCIMGKGLQFPSHDGKGVGKVVAEMAVAALNNPSGRSYCYSDPWNIVMLVSNPKDIKTLIKDNIDKFYLHDAHGSFELAFKETIFSLSGDEHKKARSQYTFKFGREVELKKDAELMQGLADRHVEKLKSAPVMNVSEFASLATMEGIAKLKLGFAELDEKDQKIVSKKINDITTEFATGKFQFAKKVFGKKVVDCVMPSTQMGKDLKVGREIVKQMLQHNLENIRGTDNFLRNFNLESESAIHKITEAFVVGHDTTKILFRACLSLLADSNHRNVLKKLQEELDKLPGKPTRDDIKGIHYLDCIMKEALRLYSPVPDMVFTVKDMVKFEDGYLYPGDVVVISQRTVHKNVLAWGDDAAAFRPERFAEFKNDDMDECRFFPFGFKPRICVGQHFAQLEVAVLLARLLSEFDIEFVNNDEKAHHPFPYHQVFSLRFDQEEIQIKFTPRQRVECRSEAQRTFSA